MVSPGPPGVGCAAATWMAPATPVPGGRRGPKAPCSFTLRRFVGLLLIVALMLPAVVPALAVEHAAVEAAEERPCLGPKLAEGCAEPLEPALPGRAAPDLSPCDVPVVHDRGQALTPPGRQEVAAYAVRGSRSPPVLVFRIDRPPSE